MLTELAVAEPIGYGLQLTDMPASALKNFPVVWKDQTPDRLHWGFLERNLKNQANINFLLSGGGCRVFGSPRTTGTQLELAENGFGVFTRLNESRLHLECVWPKGPRRQLDCDWSDRVGQFLWVSNLYRPEDRPSLSQVPMLGPHFLEYTRQVSVVILSGL